ncbi:hypothetical protein [Phyllobacterium myrsinacearum]|uniref:Uncharacterized protein n=1 Tax=Phyllobacterium myrsinacearum TaxID=28101 RepID=A0A839ESW4_9HYPH|nr:hypothetical protein [Phyllobacterium myrsinacearum]MBA8881278.1 hypothetical protein [Phyllobacterium myrsinacearum]
MNDYHRSERTTPAASARRFPVKSKLALAVLLPCILAISNCGAMRWMDETSKSTGSSKCAGWNKIRIKPETAVYLARNDFSAGIDIDSHNLNGQSNGCWN